ncbi:hypothetical protein P9Z84_29345 [Bacillus cereus]|uniref:hypothetical protein n=1 Tax=Bacillus thuringiensis TaxID=1428 RepID=UPI000BF2C193|nr:hypothetical protein [Bacillus thuringiensis]MEC3196756.1 hypothetical protein [Bacillus cereus]PEV88466.1 hypothetical protein CN442_20940 [Bacillus thuringiensis]PFK90978.1 hypothetical protein COJ04_21525 [Bacillus thuringiensis]
MELDVKLKVAIPKAGDIIVIKWVGRPQEGYLLSDHHDSTSTYRLLNLNGSSVAFGNHSIDKLIQELRSHEAIQAYEVFPQGEFKLTLQPIGGAE